MKKVVMLCAVFSSMLMLSFAEASIYNFGITYDGTSQTLDVGSDPMAGTELFDNDQMIVDLHASSGNEWTVLDGNWNFIYGSVLVSDVETRIGDSVATFLHNGTIVAQDIDMGTSQGFVHVGAQSTTLTSGMKFDQLVIDYTLLSDPGVDTVIQEDFLRFSFIDTVGFEQFSSFGSSLSSVPEPTSLMIWGSALMICMIRRRR